MDDQDQFVSVKEFLSQLRTVEIYNPHAPPEVFKHGVPNLAPPQFDTTAPLDTLQSMATRTSLRLRFTYRLHNAMAIVMLVVLLVIVGVAIHFAYRGKMELSGIAGTAGVGGGLMFWKWQPFDRATHALVIAQGLDVLLDSLQERQRSIREITDAEKRQELHWKAAQEFIVAMRDVVKTEK